MVKEFRYVKSNGGTVWVGNKKIGPNSPPLDITVLTEDDRNSVVDGIRRKVLIPVDISKIKILDREEIEEYKKSNPDVDHNIITEKGVVMLTGGGLKQNEYDVISKILDQHYQIVKKQIKEITDLKLLKKYYEVAVDRNKTSIANIIKTRMEELGE